MFDLQSLDQTNLDSALAAATQKLGNTGGAGKMLLYKATMGESGWLLGQEALCVSGGTALVLSSSFRKGYVAFDSNSKKLGEVSAPVFSTSVADPQPLNDLPDAKVNAQTSVTVMLIEQDTQAEMKGSTTGMEQAMDGLLSQIVDKLGTGDTTFCNPLVELGVSSYQHPGGKKPDGTIIPKRKIFVPLLTVKAWCDTSGNPKAKAELEARV